MWRGDFVWCGFQMWWFWCIWFGILWVPMLIFLSLIWLHTVRYTTFLLFSHVTCNAWWVSVLLTSLTGILFLLSGSEHMFIYICRACLHVMLVHILRTFLLSSYLWVVNCFLELYFAKLSLVNLIFSRSFTFLILLTCEEYGCGIGWSRLSLM